MKLTNVQREALKQAAGRTDGLFSFDRRNEKSEAALVAAGLIEEGWAEQSQKERATKKAAALSMLRLAVAHLEAEIGTIIRAEKTTQDALWLLKDLTRTRLYLTENGRTLVRCNFRPDVLDRAATEVL